jgi:DNA-binding PadR family transcriptional regulator
MSALNTLIDWRKNSSAYSSASEIGDFQRAVLLAVSRLKDNAYGAQIRDEVQTLTQRPVHLPQVYAALARLEILQFVQSDADKEKSVGLRGRTRRYYTISARGLRLLSDGVRLSSCAGPKEPTGYGSSEEKASTA